MGASLLVTSLQIAKSFAKHVSLLIIGAKSGLDQDQALAKEQPTFLNSP